MLTNILIFFLLSLFSMPFFSNCYIFQLHNSNTKCLVRLRESQLKIARLIVCSALENPDIGADLKEQSSLIFLPSTGDVFFNDEQEINRDLSTLMVKLYAEQRNSENFKRNISPKGLKVLDAFAASGIRAIRYCKEIPSVTHITLNDLDKTAVEAARRNLQLNQIPVRNYSVSQGDASSAMEKFKNEGNFFDVIDLDPFGSASPHLQAAINCLTEGGMMCVTCTDTMTFSHQPKVCFQKYGSVPVRAAYFHELSIRMLLQRIETCATMSAKYAVPLLSVSIDHYIRVFVRIFRSSKKALESVRKMAYVYQSTTSPEFYLQPLQSPLTQQITNSITKGTHFQVGGPIWAYPIHDQTYIHKALEKINEKEEEVAHRKSRIAIGQLDRLGSLLRAISCEVKDVPLYYMLTPGLSSMAKVRHMPKLLPLIAAIRNAGYLASRMHREPRSIKTDAPIQLVCELVQLWDKERWYEKLQENPSLQIPESVKAFESQFKADFTVSDDFEREQTVFFNGLCEAQHQRSKGKKELA
mmetsp:Transcript_274/g.509  ORF Transcript_274/g.509 Transcript_274/m.509 type:complete len:526 (+) Transcript_274:112-1689(+)